MGRLIQRIERHPFAAVADRLRGLASRLGGGRERRQRPGTPLTVLVAGDQHPLIIEPGQQLAAAQRECLLVLTGVDQRLECVGVDPHFGVCGKPDALAGGDQHAVGGGTDRATDARQRVAQAGTGARVQHIWPQSSGDLRAGVDPWVQREPAEQRLRGAADRRGNRLAVDFERGRPEHADTDHCSGQA